MKKTFLFLLFLAVCFFGKAQPTGLICEFLENPAAVEDRNPEFGWIVNSPGNGIHQVAYEIMVASSGENLEKSSADIWSSGKVKSSESSNVEYQGKPLSPLTTYYWKVRVTDNTGKTTESGIAEFTTGKLNQSYSTSKHPLTENYLDPRTFERTSPNNYFIDFGKDGFGTLVVDWPQGYSSDSVEIRMGEMLSGAQTIRMNPPGTIRAYKGKLKLKDFHGKKILEMPRFRYPSWADPREHVPVPHEISNIMPFRYCEILNAPGELKREQFRRIEIIYPFNDDAASFTSSNDTLNKIWDLCKYTIKATTFCGVYVDGDRERKPYEADAYINQLSHYSTDREYALARYSYEYFFEHPTWPTEWKFHSILMAWQDYMYTGNKESLVRFYDQLKNDKLFLKPVSPEGLIMDTITKTRKNDIIDWPAGERDGYDLRDVNSVVNAFYYGAMATMSQIARVTGRMEDSKQLQQKAGDLKNLFNRTFFNISTGLYVDAAGSTHSSLHANMFALYFGLVPEKNKAKVIEFVKSRKMACSVYAAQYLMDMLYSEGQGDYAFQLLTSTGERSWWNMLRSGSTIAMEAWDIKFKPNLDWNHAWGAVPANIIPTGIFGIQPLEPGFAKFRIKPQMAGLGSASIKAPCIKGFISATFKKVHGKTILTAEIPANTSARIFMPSENMVSSVLVNDRPTKGKWKDGFIELELPSGKYNLEVD